MTDIKQNWVAVERVTRRISSSCSKTGCQAHHLNLNDGAFRLLCSPDNAGVGQEIQVVVMRNEATGGHLVALARIDDYQSLLNALNKE